MIRKNVDASIEKAILLEAAKASRYARLVGEPDAVYYAMRNLLVDTLGYMTEMQYELAIELIIEDVLPRLDEEEQAQLEYEYQITHNI